MTLEIKEPELTKPVLVNIKGDVRQLRERLEQYNQFNQVNIDNINGKDEKLAFELRRELMRLRTEALAFVQGLDGVFDNFETLK
jgi:hypothetical protein